MRSGLSPADLGDLLESKLTCTLATYRRSGDVFLSPVWFVWRDGGFDLILGRESPATKHVRNDPRASVALYESEMPLRGIEVSGQGEIFEDFKEVRRAMWQRYAGVEPPGTGDGEVGIRVTGRVRAWDFADDVEDWLQS